MPAGSAAADLSDIKPAGGNRLPKATPSDRTTSMAFVQEVLAQMPGPVCTEDDAVA
jgi:hypothetical protein